MKKSLGAKTIVYPTPVFVVGTYDKDGKANLMTVAWGGICNSNPPSIAISLREATYTYGCIMESQAFTVNVPSADQVKIADYVGMATGREVDKFKELGLTAIKSDLVNAPYIEEFPMVLECHVEHTYKLGLHTQFIGQILDVKANESVLDEQGKILVEQLRPIVYSPGNQSYYQVGDCIGQAFSIGRRTEISF